MHNFQSIFFFVTQKKNDKQYVSVVLAKCLRVSLFSHSLFLFNLVNRPDAVDSVAFWLEELHGKTATDASNFAHKNNKKSVLCTDRCWRSFHQAAAHAKVEVAFDRI